MATSGIILPVEEMLEAELMEDPLIILSSLPAAGPWRAGRTTPPVAAPVGEEERKWSPDRMKQKSGIKLIGCAYTYTHTSNVQACTYCIEQYCQCTLYIVDDIPAGWLCMLSVRYTTVALIAYVYNS